MTENDLRKFSPLLQPQLQKIVQDIKKNDGSILNKLRRLKSKPVPRLPDRDYRGEDREESEDSDPEYDNETYEPPGVDDSYEPPPSHQHRVFSSRPLPRGEYVDSCRGGPVRPPKKPHQMGRVGKRLPLPPRPNHEENDEEDYVSPDGSNDEDNYIEPEDNPPHRGKAVRNLPKVPPQRPSSPDCYEVPDTEMKPQVKPQVRIQPPVLNRLCPVPSQPHSLPPTPSPRLPPRSTTPEPTGDDEYEVCDANDKCSSDIPRESRPLPHPKPRRSPKPPMKPKVPTKPSFREFDSNQNRTLPAAPSEAATPPAKSFSLDVKRPKIPVPHFMSHKQTDKKLPDVPDRDSVEEDEEAELNSKPWFAGSCDRKTADDVLVQSNQDGAFLVRNSSGHDAQQPYTLVVLYNGRVYNIPIRFLPGSQQFALGREKKGEEYFSSLTHIIEHHQRTPLVLIDSQSNSKDATRLCVPVKP